MRLRPCGAPGCAELVSGDSARCPAHARAQALSGADRRPSAAKRGYDRKWREARRAFLARPENVLCRRCVDEGRTTLASEVDHKTPHKGDPGLFWDVRNWQPLCKPCHSRKTLEEGSFGRATELVKLTRPTRSKLFVVCGPDIQRCIEYAQKHMLEDGALLNVELIAARKAKTDRYCATKKTDRNAALLDRNRMLLDLCQDNRWSEGWLVTAAPRFGDRRHWRNVASDVFVIPTALHDCLTSIAKDDWRGKDYRARYAREWWDRYVTDTDDRIVRA